MRCESAPWARALQPQLSQEMQGQWGREGRSAPRAWRGAQGQRSGLSCDCTGVLRSFVHPCSKTSNLLLPRPGLISHPSSPAPLPSTTRTALTQLPHGASRCPASPLPHSTLSGTSWQITRAKGCVFSASGASSPLPAALSHQINTQCKGAEQTAPAGNKAQNLLYFNPVKGLLGSEAEPGCAELRMKPYF